MTTRKNGMTTKRRVAAIVAAGGLAAGSATAFAATHTGGTTATSATISAATAAMPVPGGAPPGSGGPSGPGGPGGGLTITGVSGRTILTRDGSGRTITVRVGATTTYSEAGARATLSDLRAGEQIAVQASSGSTARATTLTATRVTIILPQVMGRVTAMARGSFTVAGFNGATVTVKTTAATRYVKASGAAVSASTLKKGAAIMAEGALVGNGKTLTARRVTIGVSTTSPGSAPNGGPPPGGTGGAPPPSGTPGA